MSHAPMLHMGILQMQLMVAHFLRQSVLYTSVGHVVVPMYDHHELCMMLFHKARIAPLSRSGWRCTFANFGLRSYWYHLVTMCCACIGLMRHWEGCSC